MNSCWLARTLELIQEEATGMFVPTGHSLHDTSIFMLMQLHLYALLHCAALGTNVQHVPRGRPGFGRSDGTNRCNDAADGRERDHRWALSVEGCCLHNRLHSAKAKRQVPHVDVHMVRLSRPSDGRRHRLGRNLAWYGVCLAEVPRPTVWQAMHRCGLRRHVLSSTLPWLSSIALLLSRMMTAVSSAATTTLHRPATTLRPHLTVTRRPSQSLLLSRTHA